MLKGSKTYLAAAGFALLGLYYLLNGQMEKAGQSFLAALTAVGLRSAIGTPAQQTTSPPAKAAPLP